MKDECHYFHEPDSQRNLNGDPIIKNGGTKIKLCGKGKHMEEIKKSLEKIGFKEKEGK